MGVSVARAIAVGSFAALSEPLLDRLRCRERCCQGGKAMPFRRSTIVACGLFLASIGTAAAQQQDHATPEEVVQRVRQATQDLAGSGEAGLATYRGKNATSVWKDSYVFVVSCDGDEAMGVAHPIQPQFDGPPVAQSLTYGPKPGEQLAGDFCTQGRKPRGGWVEYNFPKPGGTEPERKVSYLLAVPGTPYVVGAGIYEPTARIEELDELSRG
jgi:cytochrome c